MEQVVLTPENLPQQLRILANDLKEIRPIQEQLGNAMREDDLAQRILEAVRKDTSMKEITLAECSEQDGKLFFRGKQYVPEDLEL
jgi:hypothetical protein